MPKELMLSGDDLYTERVAVAPPSLQGLPQRFPRPRHQRVIRRMYREARQEALGVLSEMRYLDYEDGNVGFCFPGSGTSAFSATSMPGRY